MSHIALGFRDLNKAKACLMSRASTGASIMQPSVISIGRFPCLNISFQKSQHCTVCLSTLQALIGKP